MKFRSMIVLLISCVLILILVSLASAYEQGFNWRQAEGQKMVVI